MLKKILLSFLLIPLIISSGCGWFGQGEKRIKVLETGGSPLVYLDGNRLDFDVPPTIIQGRTLVPLRAIFEALGAQIDWNGATNTVTSTKGNTTIKLTIQEKIAYKNGLPITLDTRASLIHGRTMVPLRFVSEAMGATVDWEGITRTIIISSCVKKLVTVSRVVDGDTIEVQWEGKPEKIRFIGVDTPETVHPTIGEEPFGKEASQYTKNQLEGQQVYICLDVEERDRYGRLLGYAFLQNGTFFNSRLIVNGYAQVATFPPNVAWVPLFTFFQTEARNARRGLWGAAPTSETKPENHPERSYEGTLPFDPQGPDRDCGDFKTRAEAQAFFEAAGPGDPHRLDANNDGEACESLP